MANNTEKTTLTKFIELTMSCQEKQVREKLQKIEEMPIVPGLIEFRDKLISDHNNFMNDCKAILKAEKQYLKMQTN